MCNSHCVRQDDPVEGARLHDLPEVDCLGVVHDQEVEECPSCSKCKKCYREDLNRAVESNKIVDRGLHGQSR
jgi:hypothetical protein